jgi:hypothetical protein
MPLLTLIAVTFLSAANPHLHVQTLAATKSATPVPAEVAPTVSAQLGTDGTTVKVGDVAIDLWWVKAVALDSEPVGKPAWKNVADGTLVGVVRVGATWNDIRGYVVKPGIYTLRFALQPENGDHLGVSPNREFLLMAPAALDTSADVVGYKSAVDLSKKTVNRAHPSALSLDPPTATRQPLSPVSNDIGLDGVVFAVPTAFQGKPAGDLTFGLILKGTIQN